MDLVGQLLHSRDRGERRARLWPVWHRVLSYFTFDFNLILGQRNHQYLHLSLQKCLLTIKRLLMTLFIININFETNFQLLLIQVSFPRVNRYKENLLPKLFNLENCKF